MKVLMVHNYYRQKGGEDEVFAAESRLLESRGHQVVCHTVHNDAIAPTGRLRLAAGTVWSQSSYSVIRSLIRRERPDLVHFYNTFPLLSPAVYYAARAEGRAVVQSLHNYRLMCANGEFFRDGHPCEDCLGRPLALDGIIHRCYRGDRGASAAVTAMRVVHRLLGTWSDLVDVYLAGVTEWSRAKFLRSGIPDAKLVTKPNFTFPDPGPGTGRGRYAIFIGRLVPQKGVATLLGAWQRIGDRMALRILGRGPLEADVIRAAAGNPAIRFLGHRPLQEMYAELKEASFLVFPSHWYEALPRTIVDSFAVGTPVLASGLGAMASLIDHGRTGLHFQPGGADDLAAKVLWMVEHPEELGRMRAQARREYELHYTADRNYTCLMEAYAMAMQRGRR
jgi:glycosyltransferase involved in cell wall biosynthesis